MATAGDIREIMEIPFEGPTKPAPKKAKVDQGPRLTGFLREVQSLMSDSHNVPPIPIVDNARYKAKPTHAPRAFKARKWEERRFHNGARTDGLDLRHWKHAVPPAAGQRLLGTSTNGTNIMPYGSTQAGEGPVAGNEENAVTHRPAPIRYDDEFPMEKFNVKASVPSYTAEQYEVHFKSEDWTKQETDYLMGLCRDFDLRWIIVTDRYDPSEIPTSTETAAVNEFRGESSSEVDGGISGDAMAIDSSTAPSLSITNHRNASPAINGVRPPYPQRSMESLKSRYYSVASKMLSINTPPDTMTPSEFALWEKMKNFDGRTEELRKNLAEKLFMRTKEEADEERILLEELARITMNEEDFLRMRKDLYQRLETPVLSRRPEDQSAAAMYQSSAGLGALLSNLMNREKRFKRPGMIDTGRANSGQDGNDEAERGTAGTAGDRPRKQTWEKGQHPNQYTARRNTMDTESANGDAPRKTSAMAQTPNVRALVPAEEAKYGVSHPQERITSGVQFRHEKANKALLSRSAAQTAKIQGALTELGVSARLLMPTERVCREYEKLIADIVLLLDARRGVERVTSEVKILEESRRMRLGLSKEGQDGEDADKMDVDQDGKAGEGQTSTEAHHNAGADADADMDAEGEVDDDANPHTGAVARNGTGEEAETAEVDEASNDGNNMADQAKVEGEEAKRNKDADAEADADSDANSGENPSDEEDDDGKDAAVEAEAEAEEQEDDEEDEEEEDDEEEDEPAGSPQNDEDASAGEDEEDEDEDADAVADNRGHDSDEEADEEEAPPPAPVVPTRLHKRSASVISNASRTGSNRSGVSRKKGRR